MGIGVCLEECEKHYVRYWVIAGIDRWYIMMEIHLEGQPDKRAWYQIRVPPNLVGMAETAALQVARRIAGELAIPAWCIEAVEVVRAPSSSPS